MKLIMFTLLFSFCFADTYSTLKSVVDGTKHYKTNASYPTTGQLKEIAKILDGQTNFNPLFVIALIKAESRWIKSASSLKNAYGICQITTATKKWLLGNEKNSNTCVQDVTLCLRLLSYLKKELNKAGYKNVTERHLTWCYNVGAGKVIQSDWINKSHLVWIQPKLLERSVMYYIANFTDGIYDIDIDEPGMRYSDGKIYDSIKYKLNTQFKTVYIDLKKHTLKIDTNTFIIGCGKEVTGSDTASPRGKYRIIWKLWFSRNEGGAFGNCAMRINYKYASGASAYLHGTDKPCEVGKNLTLGCISMSNWCAEILFNSTEIGDWVILK